MVLLEQRHITIVDLVGCDGEVAFPMLFDRDVFRLDVPACQPISQLALWLNTVLWCVSCAWDSKGKDTYLVDLLDLVTVHDNHVSVPQLKE